MVLIDTPSIYQMEKWPTGCESVSAVMALQALGEKIDPEEFIEKYLPRKNLEFRDGVLYGPDPQEYFIGDPHKDTFWDYGCYSGAIMKALRNYCESRPDFGYEPVDYSGHPMGDLEALLREGLPVIFWATMFLRPSSYLRSWKSFDNPMKNISWGSQEHCLLLVGYDESHDYLNDPMDTDPANETHILKDHPDVVGYDRYLVSIRHLEKQNMAVSFRKKM